MGFSSAWTKPQWAESVLQAAQLCLWRTSNTTLCFYQHLFMNTQWINVIYTILLYLYNMCIYTCTYVLYIRLLDFFNESIGVGSTKYWWIWFAPVQLSLDLFICCRLTEKLLLQRDFCSFLSLKSNTWFFLHITEPQEQRGHSPPVLHLFQWNILYILVYY